MENNMTPQTQTELDIRSHQAVFMNRVYNWMALALVITGVVAYIVVSSPALLEAIVMNQFLFYGLIFGELGLVIFLSARIHKMSQSMAIGSFLLYSLMNGLTLSVVFLMYTAGSIATTFFVTAGTFAAMSLYGYTTKKDLTSIGNLAFMALIGIIIASIVNFFLKSEMMYWIITYLGVFIFVGLTAYDTQKLKRIGAQGFDSQTSMEKTSILGALTLYLDFINLFLFLLRILGDRR